MLGLRPNLLDDPWARKGVLATLGVLFLLSVLLEWHWREAEALEVAAIAEEATKGMEPTDGGILPAANMPPAPLKGQRRAPCGPEETEHLGACWMKVAKRPPCGEFYRLGDACYMPLGEGQKRPPVTGESP